MNAMGIQVLLFYAMAIFFILLGAFKPEQFPWGAPVGIGLVAAASIYHVLVGILARLELIRMNSRIALDILVEIRGGKEKK